MDTKKVVSFLLFQYELVEKDNDFKEKSNHDYVLFKETILFLLDLIVEKKPFESSCIIYFYNNEFLNRLWIHAKNAIEYSNASNLSHTICRGNTKLVIYPVGSEYFIAREILNNFTENFEKFNDDKKRNIALRYTYLKDNDLQNEILSIFSIDDNVGFSKEFGISYIAFEYLILKTINNCKKIDGPNDIPCISSAHIKSFAEKFHISINTIEKLINGITLDSSQFKTRQREIWNFAQQERSRKRPLIQLNFDEEKWRLFAPSLLGERICIMSEDLILSPQNRLPKEWNVGKIAEKIAQCNTKIGNWFEHITVDLLSTIKIIGFKPSSRIRISDTAVIKIDSNIGPPDFIGYSLNDNSLVLIECKLLDCVFEPKGVQGELSKFLSENGEKKNYVRKFKDKLAWICENKNVIKQAISYNCRITIPDDCNSINYCFVTYYPTMLRYFYSEIPCPTLFELVDSYSLKPTWPFKFGK